MKNKLKHKILITKLFKLAGMMILFLIMSSCVTNKKYQYLQNDDVNLKRYDVLKDSVLRTYQLDEFDYKLQPGDILSVKFLSLTEEEYDFFSIKSNMSQGGGNQGQTMVLLMGYLIDEEGFIEFPIVGKVKVSGRSIFEAQNDILMTAKAYLNEPVIEVRLLNFRFTILGEVNSEGSYSSMNPRITVLEAIGLGGGFGDFADKSNIKVIRQSTGKAEVYYLDLLDENMINSPFYYLNQNDVIIVPPLRQRPYQEYFSKNLSAIVTSLSFFFIVLNFTR